MAQVGTISGTTTVYLLKLQQLNASAKETTNVRGVGNEDSSISDTLSGREIISRGEKVSA